MHILLINNGTRLLSELEDLVPGCEVTTSYSDVTPQMFSQFDLIVLSGSSTSSVMWNEKAFEREIELIRSANVPLIGICFGYELIAHAFGGTLREMTVPHTGIRTITFTDATLTSRKALSVYEHHRWVIDTLPDVFEVLAYSDDGPEAIRHKTLPLYGLQFHPEKCEDDTETRALFTRLVSSFDR